MIRSLAAQMWFNAITPLLVFMFLIGGLYTLRTIQGIEEFSETRGKDITRQAAELAEFYLFTGDTMQLTNIADQLLYYRGVQSVRFYDRDGGLLIDRQLNYHGGERFYSRDIFSEGDLFSDYDEFSSDENRILLGSVTIGMSDSELTSQQQKELHVITYFSLMTFIFTAGFSFFLGRRLVNGMNSLIRSAQSVQDGRLNKRCEENGSGELLELQRQFNHMITSINRNEQNLQSQINTATRELQDKVHELSELRQETIELEREQAITLERERIMRDVHDGIGGNLVSSLSLIDSNDYQNRQKDIRDILQYSLDDLRLIILSLGESTNFLDTLLAEFKFRIQRLLVQNQIELHWTMQLDDEEVVLQPTSSLHLLRILQEAFANIIKHAQASKIWVSKTLYDDHVELCIEDNGHFIAFQTEEKRHSNGLKNIRWRVEQLGGSVDFSTRAPSGLRLTIQFPIKKLSE